MPIPTYFASGTFTAGIGSITPPFPASTLADDIALLICESENQVISLTTANGFVEVTNSPQGTGGAGVAGSTRLAVYWKRLVGGDSAPVVADSGDHQTASICVFRGVRTAGNPWSITAGGVDTISDTSGSIPGATTTDADCLVVAICSTSQNATGTAEFSAWADAALAAVTERTDNTNTAGLGGGFGVATGEKATAGAYGPIAVTLANASFKGMMSIALVGAGGVTHQATAVLDAVATAGLVAAIRSQNALALSAAATISPDARATYGADALLDAAATLAPVARATYRAEASLQAIATLAAGAQATYRADALLAGAGNMVSTASLRSQNAALLQTIASMTSDGHLTARAEAALLGAASLSADARAIYGAGALLLAAATLASAGGVRSQNAALLQAIASMTSAPGFHHAAASAMTATATLLADAYARYAAAATLDATATMSPTARRLVYGIAVLDAVATLAAAPGFKLYGSADFSGIATMPPPIATGRRQAIAAFSGIATMVAGGTLLLNAIDADKATGRAWALVYDVDDTTLLGILPMIQPAMTIRQVNLVGYFEMTLLELHDSTSLIKYGRYVRLYYEGAGLRFRGIIRDFETLPSQDGTLLRRVMGASLAAELVFESTYGGISVVDQTAAAGFTAILARATGWTATTTGTYLNQSGRYNHQSLFEAAALYGSRARGYVRETNTARVLELKNTHAASGLIMGNVEAHGALQSSQASVAPIKGTPHFLSSGEVYNRIVPYGQGLGGETLTLQRSVRTTPYTIQNLLAAKVSIVATSYAKGTLENGDGGTVEAKNGNTTFNIGDILVAGENRAVVAFIKVTEYDPTFEDPLISSMTIGGRPAILLGTAKFGTRKERMYGFIAVNVPRGQASLSGVKKFNCALEVQLISLQDVDQVTPTHYAGTANSSGSTSASLTATSVTDSMLMLSTIGAWYSTTANPAITATAPAVEIRNMGSFGVSKKSNVSGTQAMDWTISPSSFWSLVACVINPAKVYYLEDSTSIAAHGPGKPRVKILPDIQLRIDTDSPVALANQLYDYAVNELLKTKDPVAFYAAQPDFLPDDDILPGDTLRFVFKGVAEEVNAAGVVTKRLWKDVDATFIIMGIKEVWANSDRAWELQIASVLREFPGEPDTVLGQLIGDVGAVQTALATS